MRIFRLKSELDPQKLCNELEGLDAIAIKTDIVESLEEIELAWYLAQRAFSKKKNVGKKLKYEFLLWLSGKTDISSAMESTAPKRDAEFLVVVLSDLDNREIVKRLNANEKPLGLKKSGDPMKLEQISLSRIKN